MSRLLRAELTRFLSRKITWIAFGVTLLGLAGMVALFASQSAPPSEAARASAQQNYQEAHQAWEQGHEEVDKQCEQDKSIPKDQCVWTEPKPSDFLFQATFSDLGPALVLTAVGFLGIAAAVVSSSLIGADFSSGAMSNWLSFVPVRWRVYASREVITVLGSTVIGAVISAVALGTLALIVTGQQGAAAVTGLDKVWASYGRGLVVIALGAILGSTIAFLTRRTVATVGIVLGYFVVGLIFGSVVSSTTWYAKIIPWLPESNALALVQSDYHYSVPVRTMTSDGISVDYVEKVLPWEQGLIYLVVAAVVLLAVALITFRRRDVT